METVFVYPHGTRYHSEQNCKHRKSTLIGIKKTLAREYGYLPCVCHSA